MLWRKNYPRFPIVQNSDLKLMVSRIFLGERQSIFFIFVTRNLSRRSNLSPWVWIYSPLFQSSDLQKKIFFHFSSTKFWKTDDHKTSLSQTFTSVCASKMFFYVLYANVQLITEKKSKDHTKRIEVTQWSQLASIEWMDKLTETNHLIAV